ncbi:hypothetical protein MMYC01_202939 [Madurella mycetomatis]|uniref:Uncharacterized protein n=1 Tax=Madurella mycetomatis TaxID=100816 RepID=A0A175WBE4_9PEZI|nr:hypothetical protein MMYC01_202939 [Madurella mycetomatis]
MMRNLCPYDPLLVFGHQEVVHRERREIQARVLNKNLSCQSRFPILGMVQVNKGKLPSGLKSYRTISPISTQNTLAQIPEEASSPEETARHRARASLLKWVRIILARDIGITLKRARDILDLFAAHVVKYNPNWAAYIPASHTLTWKRLAHIANTRPYDVN